MQYYLQHLRTKPEHEISKGYADPALRRYRVPIPTFVTKKLKHFHPLPKYADGRDYKTLYYGIELPQINYRFANGKPYRYVYGTGPHRRGDFLNQLLKVDVLAKEAKVCQSAALTINFDDALNNILILSESFCHQL